MLDEKNESNVIDVAEDDIIDNARPSHTSIQETQGIYFLYNLCIGIFLSLTMSLTLKYPFMFFISRGFFLTKRYLNQVLKLVTRITNSGNKVHYYRCLIRFLNFLLSTFRENGLLLTFLLLWHV